MYLICTYIIYQNSGNQEKTMVYFLHYDTVLVLYLIVNHIKIPIKKNHINYFQILKNIL